MDVEENRRMNVELAWNISLKSMIDTVTNTVQKLEMQCHWRRETLKFK